MGAFGIVMGLDTMNTDYSMLVAGSKVTAAAMQGSGIAQFIITHGDMYVY